MIPPCQGGVACQGGMIPPCQGGVYGGSNGYMVVPPCQGGVYGGSNGQMMPITQGGVYGGSNGLLMPMTGSVQTVVSAVSPTGCYGEQCVVDETVPTMGRSNEDDAIYEIFYTNPLKCCGVIVEIGAGDGINWSPSYFFEYGMNWTAILVEADPIKFNKMTTSHRPSPLTKKIHGGFCRSDSYFYHKDGKFSRHPSGAEIDFMSEYHDENMTVTSSTERINCISLGRDVLRGINHVDVLVIRAGGDPWSVVRTMNWRITVDIVIIRMKQHGDTLLSVVRHVLRARKFVESAWDIQLWCETPDDCEPNEVWLRKGFNPLPKPLLTSGLRGTVNGQSSEGALDDGASDYDNYDDETLWPDLVGMTGDGAKRIVLEADPSLEGQVHIISHDAMASMDYKKDRVRIYIDAAGIVVIQPKYG